MRKYSIKNDVNRLLIYYKNTDMDFTINEKQTNVPVDSFLKKQHFQHLLKAQTFCFK